MSVNMRRSARCNYCLMHPLPFKVAMASSDTTREDPQQIHR